MPIGPWAREGVKTGDYHPLLEPSRLVWALGTRNRLYSHRQRLLDAGLEVPLALEVTKGAGPEKCKAIRAAREELKNVAERARSRSVKMRQKTVEELKKSQGVKEVLPSVKAALDAPPVDPPGEGVVESLVEGDRVGEEKVDDTRHRIEFEVLPSMADFFEDMSNNTWCLFGPAGSGKTSHSVMKLLRHCQQHEKARYVLVRLTLPQLRDTTMKTFFDWIPRRFGVWNAEEKKFTLGGKYEFLFRAIERPEDVDNMKGLEITGYFINEAMEVQEDIKKILDQRIGRYPKSLQVCEDGVSRMRGTDKTLQILDTNPPDMEHWLVDTFIRKPLDGHRHVFNPPYENSHNLPKGYYERMRSAYRDAPDLIDRYIMGKLGAVYRGKAVYPEYNSSFHLAKSPLKYVEGLPMVGGLDFGLTPACVWAQVQPNGCVALLEELCAENMGIDEFSDAMLSMAGQKFPGADITYFADPSGSKRADTDGVSVFDILAGKGLTVNPGPVAIDIRLNAVKRRLRMSDRGAPMVLVSPTCRRVADGFAGSYAYKQIGQTGLYSDKPDKSKWSHPHDAVQYLFCGLYEAEGADADERWVEQNQYKPVDCSTGY